MLTATNFIKSEVLILT